MTNQSPQNRQDANEIATPYGKWMKVNMNQLAAIIGCDANVQQDFKRHPAK
jgi:hypothetical protein